MIQFHEAIQLKLEAINERLAVIDVHIKDAINDGESSVQCKVGENHRSAIMGEIKKNHFECEYDSELDAIKISGW